MDIKTSVKLTRQGKGVLAALDALRETYGRNGLIAILEEIGRRVSRVIVLRYPLQSRRPLPEVYIWGDGELHKFKSPRHQRAFFALLRSGRIRIPYPRTGATARDFQTLFLIRENMLVVRVLMPDPKGVRKYVLGPEGERSRYFKERTYWKALERMIRNPQQLAEIGAAVQAALDTIREALNRNAVH